MTAVPGSVDVDLPAGRVTVGTLVDEVETPWATLLLAHGAGAGMDHPFLAGFAAAMAAGGVRTVRFVFPYVQAGRRMPGPAAHAVATWRAVRASVDAAGPVFAAGKSYGGRMASMTAAEGDFDVAGLLYLGYPLHAPGKPEKPRAEHLPSVTAPQLFVEGTNDPFVDPHRQLEEAVASCTSADLIWVEGGGHSFEVKGHKRPADIVGAELVPLVLPWMRGIAG